VQHYWQCSDTANIHVPACELLRHMTRRSVDVYTAPRWFLRHAAPRDVTQQRSAANVAAAGGSSTSSAHGMSLLPLIASRRCRYCPTPTQTWWRTGTEIRNDRIQYLTSGRHAHNQLSRFNAVLTGVIIKTYIHTYILRASSARLIQQLQPCKTPRRNLERVSKFRKSFNLQKTFP